MIALSIQAPVPPTAALARLKDALTVWRESELPTELRNEGVVGLSVRIAGDTCVAQYERAWYAPAARAMSLRLRVRVVPLAGHGSLVEARARYEAASRIQIVLGSLAFAAGAVFLFKIPVLASIILTLAPALAVALLVRDANSGLTRRTDPSASYLVDRVEMAFRAIPSPSGVAPVS
jgi:hypothetical protein